MESIANIVTEVMKEMEGEIGKVVKETVTETVKELEADRHNLPVCAEEPNRINIYSGVSKIENGYLVSFNDKTWWSETEEGAKEIQQRELVRELEARK